MPTHTLIQTWNARTPAQTFVLAPGDDVNTDNMSECVSVVILHQQVGNGYTLAVGQHGGGGVGNVNLPSVLAAVPPVDRPGALAFIVSGHTALHEDYDSSNNRGIRDCKTALQAAGFVVIKILRGWSGARITDAGLTTKY